VPFVLVNQVFPRELTMIEIAQKNFRYFEGINSVEYTVKSEVEIQEKSGTERKLLHELNYKAKNEKYYFGYKQSGDLSEDKILNEEAFDGENYQALSGPYLQIKKGDNISSPTLFDVNALFLPFTHFIAAYSRAKPEAAFPNIKLSDLNNLENWIKLAQDSWSISKAENDVNIKVPGLNLSDCLKLEAKGWLSNKEVVYVVYLDPKRDYYPIAWIRSFSYRRDLRFIYFVKKFGITKIFGSEKSVFYPEEAVLLQFLGGDAPVAESKIYLNNLVFNGNDLDDDVFTFDPGSVSHIFDADGNKIIQVPN